jgi:hypothetical protein
MAFPSLRSHTGSGGGLGVSTSTEHTFATVPTHAVGDLILFVVKHGVNGSITNPRIESWSSDWTGIGDEKIFFWKVATSTEEEGITIVVNNQASLVWSYFVFSDVDTDAAPFIEKESDLTGSDTSPTITPSWGAADNLFLAVWTAQNRFQSGGAPSATKNTIGDYTFVNYRGSTGGNSTAQAQQITALRTRNTGSESPGTWDHDSSTVRKSSASTHTLALRPLGAGGGPARRRPGLMLGL